LHGSLLDVAEAAIGENPRQGQAGGAVIGA
jgi:hypothetical protein